MPRKKITRRIPPLPKRHLFRAAENKGELLLDLLRAVALSGQTTEAQPFHPLRDVAKKFHVPISLGAKIYRELEREGILRCVRGSGTLLEGLNGTCKPAVRGVVAIAVSLFHFLTRQECRVFLLMLEQQLQDRGFVAAKTFFDLGETADDLARRLKRSNPNRVIWYCPQKLSREVTLRLHDAGVSVIGVSDTGCPGIQCQYEIRREPALSKIVAEWKRESIRLIKIAVGPTRSAVDELRIAETLEDLDIGVTFVRFGSESASQFVDCLGRRSKPGVVLLNSVAFLLAMRAPDALARLLKCSRVAFIDGSISVPFANFADAIVDLVAVDWQAVSKRIVHDLTTPRHGGFTQTCLLEATARLRVPLN